MYFSLYIREWWILSWQLSSPTNRRYYTQNYPYYIVRRELWRYNPKYNYDCTRWLASQVKWYLHNYYNEIIETKYSSVWYLIVGLQYTSYVYPCAHFKIPSLAYWEQLLKKCTHMLICPLHQCPVLMKLWSGNLDITIITHRENLNNHSFTMISHLCYDLCQGLC